MLSKWYVLRIVHGDKERAQRITGKDWKASARETGTDWKASARERRSQRVVAGKFEALNQLVEDPVTCRRWPYRTERFPKWNQQDENTKERVKTWRHKKGFSRNDAQVNHGMQLSTCVVIISGQEHHLTCTVMNICASRLPTCLWDAGLMMIVLVEWSWVNPKYYPHFFIFHNLLLTILNSLSLSFIHSIPTAQSKKCMHSVSISQS